MISLILPPKSQIPLAAKMLADEYGTASNIKSRVNRLSVLTAITSTQQRLKLYNRCPENGLVIYCGEVMTDDGKIKKVRAPARRRGGGGRRGIGLGGRVTSRRPADAHAPVPLTPLPRPPPPPSLTRTRAGVHRL
jgi:hypothetical protein